MSDDESAVTAPSGALGRIRYSISTLWEEFGRTDNITLAVAINTAMVALGVIVWWLGSGWLSPAGAVWALINAYPFVQWVIGR